MDFEETRRLDLVGYDEKTETWYLQARDGRPLQLTRQSLTRLVQLYNSIHKGSPLVLLEQREVRRLEETRQRHSETLRDLYLFLDRKERRRPFRLLSRALGATLRLFATLFSLPGAASLPSDRSLAAEQSGQPGQSGQDTRELPRGEELPPEAGGTREEDTPRTPFRVIRPPRVDRVDDSFRGKPPRPRRRGPESS